jgi:hypothetical protein
MPEELAWWWDEEKYLTPKPADPEDGRDWDIPAIISEAQRREREEIVDAVRGVIVGAGPLANEEFSKGLFDGWQMTKEAVLRLIDERGKRS